MKTRSLQNAIKTKLKLNHVQSSNPQHPPPQQKINRSSSQRISLFKYPYVQVETISDQNRPTGKLLANGPIEIYEMRTISLRSFFFSVGRHGEWIHPMLPKLRIRRVIDESDNKEFSLFVLFSNPDRIWKIKFINSTDQNIDDEEEDWIVNLEKVITGICQYSCVKTLKDDNDNNNNEDDEDDELNFLLESDSDNDTNTGDEITMINKNEFINKAFQRAMNNIIPQWQDQISHDNLLMTKIRHKNQQTLINERRRISLYIPQKIDPTFPQINTKQINRRSISAFSDYETLISLNNLKL